MTITEKFKKRYIPGFDCRLSTFRNCLAFNDIVLSNSMVLGLSGTLIFCFNDGKIYSRLPHFVIAGINDQSLEGLAFNLNIYLLRGRMLNINDVRLKLGELLNHSPVNIAINRQRLHQIRGLENNQINMGFHFVTVTDYDLNSGEVTIFETDFTQPIVITENQLEEIWFSDLLQSRSVVDPLQLVDGQWYSFFCSKEFSRDDLIKASIRGIEKVITNFFTSPVDFIIGESALLSFKQYFLSLSEEDLCDRTIKESLLLFSAMESGMSGGGLGRKIYSYFLSELGTLLGDLTLKSIATNFKDQAILWRVFTSELSNGANANDQRNFIHENIERLVDGELECMNELKLWLKNRNTYEI